jgi:hypothetical protein
MDENDYGKPYEIADEVMAGLYSAVDAGLCVPQSTGELILERQMYTLQILNLLIEDILEGSSTIAGERSKKPVEAARVALSKTTIDQRPKTLSLQDLKSSASDQKILS